MNLRSFGIYLILIGASIYLIGLIFTPIPPEIFYGTETKIPFNPIWPHSSPLVNLVATIGFDIAIIGAILSIVMMMIPPKNKRVEKEKST